MQRPYFYLGKSRGLTQLSTGELFVVDTEAVDLSTWILLGGVWETHVDDVLCALVRPGDTFIDVGANMGYYTVKMARRVGAKGRTYSFEPNPLLHRLLTDNLKINAFDWGRTFNLAAGAEPGRMVLSFERGYPGGGRVAPEGVPGAYEHVEVDVVRIDDVVPADVKADLIKIDVEGFEPLALMGMRGLLARSPDAAIVTEINYEEWSRHGDPAALIRELAAGRRIYEIRPDGRIDPLGDGGAVEHAIHRLGVTYVLIAPVHRLGVLKRFERHPVEAARAAAAAEEGAPPPRPSLLRRALRRLGRG